MSKVITLKRGLDIPIKGEADKAVRSKIKSELYALKPADFRGVTPRMAVKAGERVLAGDILFTDKNRPEIQFASPVSGTVEEIRRGEKRRILEVIVRADEEMSYRSHTLRAPAKYTREEMIGLLLESGFWPMVRQRPYDIIADPKAMPKAVVVSGFDSGPLAPDFEMTLKREKEALQMGFDCLARLSDRPVVLNLPATASENSVFNTIQGVEVNRFKGPHPAGNVGVQIHHLFPIAKGETVWVVNAADVALIGRFFLTGRYDLTQMIALAGSEVKHPAYYNVIKGVCVHALLDNRLNNKVHQRIISGNPLSGTVIGEAGYLGFYDNMLAVIPEGDNYEFLGWAAPGFSKFSVSRTFPSFLFPKSFRFKVDANTHGEQRAFVISGQYEKVLPMDIYPVYLLKAVLSKDLDKMEQLGIYEVVPEDLALCEFVCTSKIPVQQILNDGILLMMKELS